MSFSFYEPPPYPVDEARRAKAVEESGVLSVREDEVLCTIVAETRRRFRAVSAAVSVVHGDYQHLIAASGMPTGLYSRRTSFCGHAVASGDRVFQVPDASADPRFEGNPWVNGDEGRLAYYAAAVLHDDDGHPLGTLCVTDLQPRDLLTDIERAELLRFATQVEDRLKGLRADGIPLLVVQERRAVR